MNKMKKIEIFEIPILKRVWDCNRIAQELTGGRFCYITRNPVYSFTNGARHLAILDEVTEDGKLLKFRVAPLAWNTSSELDDKYKLETYNMSIEHLDNLKVEIILEKLEDDSLIWLENLTYMEVEYPWNAHLEIDQSYHIYDSKTKEWKYYLRLNNITDDYLEFYNYIRENGISSVESIKIDKTNVDRYEVCACEKENEE
jgi:hypothetical protein